MNARDLWELADTLLIQLENRQGVIYGEGQHDVNLEIMRLPVKVEVVSSAVFETGGVAVLCKTVGNVGLLAISHYPQGALCTVTVFDIAKLKGRPDSLLETKQADTPEKALALLDRAIVATFVKSPARKWVEQKAA